MQQAWKNTTYVHRLQDSLQPWRDFHSLTGYLQPLRICILLPSSACRCLKIHATRQFAFGYTSKRFKHLNYSVWGQPRYICTKLRLKSSWERGYGILQSLVLGSLCLFLTNPHLLKVFFPGKGQIFRNQLWNRSLTLHESAAFSHLDLTLQTHTGCRP